MLMKSHSLVIGGTRGLGREVVQLLLKEENLVSVIGRHEPAVADKSRSGVSYWTVDVSDATALAGILTEIVQRNGRLNNLVLLQRFKGEGDKWTGEIETSLSATKNIVEMLAEQFNNSGDNSIVVVSSIADQFISETQPVGYHVAKAGLC